MLARFRNFTPRVNAQVGDMIRATIVCIDGDAVFEAWKRCSSDAGFRITPDHGRLKNSFGTKNELPKMLCNVHIEEKGYLPCVAEIQILLHDIYEIKNMSHRECAHALLSLVMVIAARRSQACTRFAAPRRSRRFSTRTRQRCSTRRKWRGITRVRLRPRSSSRSLKHNERGREVQSSRVSLQAEIASVARDTITSARRPALPTKAGANT